jgi:hypothetical protein
VTLQVSNHHHSQITNGKKNPTRQTMKPKTAGGGCGLGRISAEQEKIKNLAASPKEDKENLFLPLSPAHITTTL